MNLSQVKLVIFVALCICPTESKRNKRGLFDGTVMTGGPNTCSTTEYGTNDGKDNDNVSGQNNKISISKRSDFSSSNGIKYSSFMCNTRLDVNTCKVKKVFENGTEFSRVQRLSCCHGYKKQGPNRDCTKVDLKDMATTLKAIGGEKFYNLAVAGGMEDVLKNSNLTIFCPSDDVMDGAANQVNDLVKNHMISGIVRAGYFDNDGLVLMMNGKTKLRTNIFYDFNNDFTNSMVTVNCVRVNSTDNFATNGVVHKVDKIIKPATDTVADIISKKSEFGMLNKLIIDSDLLSFLSNAESHVTLFAPTDEAFEKSGVDLKKLKSDGCLEALLENHILNNVVCSSAINGQCRYKNLLGRKLKLKRDSSNQKLYVGDDNVQIIAKDLVATNGVVHIIDGVDVPVESTQLLEVLSDYGYSAITDAIKRTKLKDVLQNTDNSMFIVPDEQAFQALPDNIKNDNDRLKDLLLYHFIAPAKSVVTNDEKVKAKNGKLIRFNSYKVRYYGKNTVTAQCVPIQRTEKICGGEIKFAEKVLKPASGTVMDIINNNNDYSRMRQIIETAKMTELLAGDEPHTLFVPTDSALVNALSRDELTSVTNEKEEAKKLVRTHILPVFLCCAGIGRYFDTYRSLKWKALDGTILTSISNPQSIFTIDGKTIQKCDVVAENGVVHEIDGVIGRRRSDCYWNWNC